MELLFLGGCRSCQFLADSVDCPGWAAAAEEVVVAGEDPSVEDEREGDRSPVIEVTGTRLRAVGSRGS